MFGKHSVQPQSRTELFTAVINKRNKSTKLMEKGRELANSYLELCLLKMGG